MKRGNKRKTVKHTIINKNVKVKTDKHEINMGKKQLFYAQKKSSIDK